MKRTTVMASTIAVSLALAFAAPATATPSTFEATALPNLPGGTASSAADVNDAGQIVGWALTGGSFPHAVLWQDGDITDLGTFGTDTVSYATAISDNGLIVGVSGANPLEPSETGHAVLWQDGQIIDLGLLPGGLYSDATDVNERRPGRGVRADGRASRAVEGSPGVPVGGRVRAILPPLQPESDLLSTSSCATSINDQGVVAGNSGVYNVQTGELTWRAVTWQNAVPVDRGTVAGDPHSLASAISQNGKIVGVSGTFYPGEPVRFAAIWTGRDVRPLARPDAALWTSAVDVNERGVVVGQYATADEMNGCRWIGGTVSPMLPRPGDTSSAALGINDHGLIVGWSADASSGLHAVTWQ